MSNDRAGTPAELAAKHWWKRFIQSLPDTGTVDTLSPSFPPLSTVQSGDRRCSSLCSLLGPGAKPGLCAEGCIPGRTSDATRAVKAQGLGFKWGTSNTLHLFYTLTKDKNEEENLYTAGCTIIQYPPSSVQPPDSPCFYRCDMSTTTDGISGCVCWSSWAFQRNPPGICVTVRVLKTARSRRNTCRCVLTGTGYFPMLRFALYCGSIDKLAHSSRRWSNN